MDIIETVSLFPELNRRLIELLKSQTDDEWRHSTRFENWKVKDIAAHLLDTSIRRLSIQRDGYLPDAGAAISSYRDLVQYVTKLADTWAFAFERVSPGILIDLIEEYQGRLAEFLRTLPPMGTARFSVDWAGEASSLNWFDIAREYTERWHHQMQIRDVLGRPPLYERRLYYPVLDAFMRALPHHYRNRREREGYCLRVAVTGDAGGNWNLVRSEESWELTDGMDTSPDTSVSIAAESAWKLFTRWVDKNEIGGDVTISGDSALGEHVLDMVCILM